MWLAKRIKRYWMSLGEGLLPIAVKVGAVRQPELVIAEVDDNPGPAIMANNVLYKVQHEEWPKWADFKCPCGCGDVISISIAEGRNSWKLKRDFWGRPSLHPSVWRKAACKSHFWVRKGKIHWC